MSEHAIFCELKRANVRSRPAGWQPDVRYASDGGTEVRSIYEQRVANWLEAHDIDYEYEPVPFGDASRADFLANGWFIEVWGVRSSDIYKQRQKRKRRMYAERGLPLIELSYFHFKAAQQYIVERRLRQVLTNPIQDGGSAEAGSPFVRSGAVAA